MTFLVMKIIHPEVMIQSLLFSDQEGKIPLIIIHGKQYLTS